MAKTPALDVSNINPKVLEAEYAVRGAIAVKSQKYAESLADGATLDFPKIVQCNIGALLAKVWHRSLNVVTNNVECYFIILLHHIQYGFVLFSLLISGNPQVLGQKPITFFRQVLSICDYPEV